MTRHTLAHVNVNEVHDKSMSIGQRIADSIAKVMGSWRFVIVQSIVLFFWALLNSVAWWIWKWDAYPFIAMNLLLSCQAAYATPLIMMSQNRQSDKDRIAADADFHTNLAAKEEIEEILARIEAQDVTMIKQHQEVLELLRQQTQGKQVRQGL